MTTGIPAEHEPPSLERVSNAAASLLAADAALRVADAAAEQRRWAAAPLEQRLAVLRRFRHRLADASLEVAAVITRRHVGETLAAEIWPLLEATRFLERRAYRVLAARRPARRGWPLPGRSRVTVVREPYGVVLIIGPGNYGLMLAGVQTLQALAAGNAVIVKPAPGTRAALERLARLLQESGLPPGLVTVTADSAETAEALLESDIDRIVFTGSSAVGRGVLARAAARLVPAVLELSGWDACVVLADANLGRVADALLFTLRSNRGETCVAPRRVLVVDAARAAQLEERLRARLHGEPELLYDRPVATRAAALIENALAMGARLAAGRIEGDEIKGPVVLADVSHAMAIFSTEVFAPLTLISAVDTPDEAVALANQSDHALGASVFGSPRRARLIASQLHAGLVTINDVVAPLADPEVPLAARDASGFGVTRGAEGLLAMTRPKALTEPRLHFTPHHTLRPEGVTEAVAALAALVHGSLRAKLRALRTLLTERGFAERVERGEREGKPPAAAGEPHPERTTERYTE